MKQSTSSLECIICGIIIPLMQIFIIDDVVMNYAERNRRLWEIMALAKSELRLSSSGNDERGSHGCFNSKNLFMY